MSTRALVTDSAETGRRPRLSVVSGDPASPQRSVDPLVEGARAGDRHAWRQLYQREYRKLVRHATYLCGEVGRAEDAVQEAFSVAVVRIDRYDGRVAFVSWMRGIVTNVVRSSTRKQRRRARAYSRLEEVEARTDHSRGSDPERSVETRARAIALYEALDELPDSLREAFIYCDVEQVPSQQAAAELGITPGNLRVRATRARARLRELIEARSERSASG